MRLKLLLAVIMTISNFTFIGLGRGGIRRVRRVSAPEVVGT
jgi:hypothetical protein